ncbi:MAG: 1-(5-phosphoribosyl)-5-[(5-phosphoribosylamino)methylideneamino]imidazole-4-carboxamide isomerase [Pyrinomonadaceae bacterium]
MIEIIPAIDLIDGKCVRLTQGDFERKKIYSNDPLETAKQFEAAGLKRLHIVDLDGAKTGSPKNLNVLAAIANATNLVIDFGGGIKTEIDLNAVFSAGATIANIGSLAIKEPAVFFTWLAKYGSSKILLGADSKDGKAAINGWQTTTEKDILEMLIKYADRGVKQVFVTDIGRDGEMKGPAILLYKAIRKALPNLSLIASGGVSSLTDIEELERIGCTGVIIGKAIYEGKIELNDLRKYAG